MSIMNIAYIETPIGVLRIKSKDNRLVEIHAMQESEPFASDTRTDEECEVVSATRKQLDEYFLGERQNFDLPLNMSQGSRFEQSVWRVLQEIPYGETLSYGQVAKKVGCPKGARAVGNAVGSNPLLIVVPCHRVIKGDGTIGGFSAGLEKKRGLMRIEKISLLKEK